MPNAGFVDRAQSGKNRAHWRAASNYDRPNESRSGNSANKNQPHQTSEHPLYKVTRRACQTYPYSSSNLARHPEAADSSTDRPGCEAVVCLPRWGQCTAPAIRLLLRFPCNPDARDPVATTVQPRFTRGWCIHIFSIEFAIWRGRWRRPCVECAFYSHTRIGL